MEETKELIIDKIRDLERSISRRMDEFCTNNAKEHNKIIGHQEYQNGELAEIRKRQLLLRGILIGAVIILVILGFMPERLWEMLKMAF